MSSVLGQDLEGREAFSQEGTKLGRVKAVIGDGASAREYLVIGRVLRRDLIIPADAVETPSYRVVVPHSSAFIDSAPAIKAKGAISLEEGDRLEGFYRAHPA